MDEILQTIVVNDKSLVIFQFQNKKDKKSCHFQKITLKKDS